MNAQKNGPPRISIALVDGDAAMRHARQLLLRAEGSDVRAYPSCAAALGDPAAIASDYVVADVEMTVLGGVDFLRLMRAAGWQGKGILLADMVSPALRLLAIDEGFSVMSSAAFDGRRLSRAVDNKLDGPAADYA